MVKAWPDPFIALFLTSLTLAALQPAVAQTGSPSASSPAAATPAMPSEPPAIKGPSFQSGGLKVTVVSTSTGLNSNTLSLILENKAQADALVAVIGPAFAINSGQTYTGSVGGLASCMIPADHPRSDQIKSCLSGPTPTLPVQQFTLLEHGNAVPLTVSFNGGFGMKIDKEQPISFAMTVAMSKDTESSAGGDTLQPTHPSREVVGIPPSLRFVSLGIPVIPPSE